MSWLGFAFLTAFFESGKDVFGKKSLERSDEYVVAGAWRVFALPFLLPLLLVIDIPPLEAGFWWALLVSGGINVVTAILYMRAIRLSDLSITVPMVSFTPLFLLLTSPLLLGESPEPEGIVGIVLIVLGSYLLNLHRRDQGFWTPFRALLSEPGPRLMLLVALLWSITANVDKIGLQHSSPVLWAIAVNIVIACGLAPVILYRRAMGLGRIRGNLVLLSATGFCGAMTSLSQMTAISLTLVPHVIAIKRTSTLLSVVWGHFLFRESGFRKRLAGSAVMLAGVLLILWP
jgi:drug/metabolite transporter (DMT)-like permease